MLCTVKPPVVVAMCQVAQGDWSRDGAKMRRTTISLLRKAMLEHARGIGVLARQYQLACAD